MLIKIATQKMRLLLVFALVYVLPLCSGEHIPNISDVFNTTSDPGAFAAPPPIIDLPPIESDHVPPANDDLWNRCTCKGTKFLAQMSYSDYDVGQLLPVPQTTAQSRFEVSSLWDWGYDTDPVQSGYCDFSSNGIFGISRLLRQTGFSDKCVSDGGTWVSSAITHFEPQDPQNPDPFLPPINRQTYEDPYGYMRRKTGAYFYISVSAQGGLMVLNALNPRHAANIYYPGNAFPDYELPELQRCSDMLWVDWNSYVPNDRKRSIAFMASLAITNRETLGVIARVLGHRVADRGGILFDAGSEEGRALLGTPSGAAFAHFLIQRKNQVGLKTIDKVWLVDGETIDARPNLFFMVKDLQQPVPRPVEGTKAVARRYPMGHHVRRMKLWKEKHVIRRYVEYGR